MKEFAPIVVFTYNRLLHTKRTIESLSKNKLAVESDLFIFSDGPKPGSEDKVNEVRKYLPTITGFKSVTIHESPVNRGLATSIIEGVTKIINQFGKIIVLEDDLLTSPFFLTFMNNALDYYINQKKIWNINAWSPFFFNSHHFAKDIYFTRLASSWGWATWVDRWQYYEKNTEMLIKEFTPAMIKEFNLKGNCCFWPQVLWNKSGKYNTWAIYWYATIFKNNGYCIGPAKSFVANIGMDGSGEHTSGGNNSVIDLNQKENIIFDLNIKENIKSLRLLRKYYREPGIVKKIFRKLFKLINKIGI